MALSLLRLARWGGSLGSRGHLLNQTEAYRVGSTRETKKFHSIATNQRKLVQFYPTQTSFGKNNLLRQQTYNNLSLSRFFAEESTSVVKTDKVATGGSGDLFSDALKELEQKEAEILKASKSKGGVRVRGEDEALATDTKIKASGKKVRLIVSLMKGMPYERALHQLKLGKKVLCVPVAKLLETARFNAENIHNLDPTRLIVSECWIGRKTPLKRIRYHGKGGAGRMHRQRSQLTIVLKELPVGDSRLKRVPVGRSKGRPPYWEVAHMLGSSPVTPPQ